MTRPVALVTGAARGIGLATTKLFLAEGWQVAMIDIDGAELQSAAAPLDNVLAVEGDVSDPEAVTAMIDEVTSKLGGITALVNNAGRRRLRPDRGHHLRALETRDGQQPRRPVPDDPGRDTCGSKRPKAPS